MPKGIPSATVSRLVIYLRVLTDLESEGVSRASSDHLAAEANVSAFQVRKDLAYFGSFGTRGSGYTVATLKNELRRILGLTRPWRVIIVGMGRLGQALAAYPQLDQYDFKLVAGVDVDASKVGSLIGDLPVHHLDDLHELVAEQTVDIAFLAVPVDAAQDATDALVRAGVPGILNFVPTVVTVPAHVTVESVDFLAGLKRLAYFLQVAPHDGEREAAAG